VNAKERLGVKKQGRKPARIGQAPPADRAKDGGKTQRDNVKKDSRLDMEKPPKPQN